MLPSCPPCFFFFPLHPSLSPFLPPLTGQQRLHWESRAWPISQNWACDWRSDTLRDGRQKHFSFPSFSFSSLIYSLLPCNFHITFHPPRKLHYRLCWTDYRIVQRDWVDKICFNWTIRGNWSLSMSVCLSVCLSACPLLRINFTGLYLQIE